jgi:uncharacterized membrane protein
LRGDFLFTKTQTLLLRYATVFIAGAFAYGIIEVLARGFTHISMGILGGAAMCLIHSLNNTKRTPVHIFTILLISAVFITVGEFITGEIVNVRMGLQIWDYSMLPMNYDGQICLPFTMLWFALSAVGILFDDFLRIHLMNEHRLTLNLKKRTTV